MKSNQRGKSHWHGVTHFLDTIFDVCARRRSTWGGSSFTVKKRRAKLGCEELESRLVPTINLQMLAAPQPIVGQPLQQAVAKFTFDGGGVGDYSAIINTGDGNQICPPS